MDLQFIEDEMLTHIPICTHQEPKRVLAINGTKEIDNELQKYKFDEIINIDATNAIAKLSDIGSRKFDIAIVATSKFTSNREFWIELTKMLDEKGVVAIKMSNIISNKEEATKELKLAGSVYQIAMPYRYESFKDGEVVENYLMLASRFYHPTADINLQRADLTDGHRYYNSDIAIACFAVPTFVYKDYLGVIKR